MRLIRKLVVLTIISVGGVAAYNYWSDHGWPLRSRATTLDTADVKREAVKLATRASAKASVAASQVGVTISEGALTAKIKSKMALDDHVKARDINVDTEGSVATLTGVVASADERKRAVQLARDTDGITRVVDKLEVKRP